MTTEFIANLLIVLHIIFGTVALLVGLVPVTLPKKVDRLHKITGKIFVITMLITAVSSLIISLIPTHENPFLFGVGVFSTYLTLSGNRALKFKSASTPQLLDRLLAIFLLLVGIGMLFSPILLFNGRINMVLEIMGLAAVIFAVRDLALFKRASLLKEKWLTLHIGKIMGAYISATTAFVVTNSLIPGIFGWILPSIVGSIYIAYWIRKITVQHPD